MAVPQIFSSTRVNKTTADGKVFITGDHNEVVVSTARETKMELAEIKSKLQLLGKRDEKFSEKSYLSKERLNHWTRISKGS